LKKRDLKGNGGRGESSKERVIFRTNENQEMKFVSTKKFYDLFIYLFFTAKCQHLVFENKQENKSVNKYNILQAKHEFVNF
jgi:hypothetical protein